MNLKTFALLSLLLSHPASIVASERETQAWKLIHATLEDYAKRLDKSDQHDAFHQAGLYQAEQKIREASDKIARLWKVYPDLLTDIQNRFDSFASEDAAGSSMDFIAEIEERLLVYEERLASHESRIAGLERRVEIIENTTPAVAPSTFERASNSDSTVNGVGPLDRPTKPLSRTQRVYPRLVFNHSQLCTHCIPKDCHVNTEAEDGQLYHGDTYEAHGELVLLVRYRL